VTVVEDVATRAGAALAVVASLALPRSTRLWLLRLPQQLSRGGWDNAPTASAAATAPAAAAAAAAPAAAAAAAAAATAAAAVAAAALLLCPRTIHNKDTRRRPWTRLRTHHLPSLPPSLLLIGRPWEGNGLGALFIGGDANGGEHLAFCVFRADGEGVEEEVLVSFNQRVFKNVFGFRTVTRIDLEQSADESGEAPAIDGGEGVVGPAHDDLAEVLDAGGEEGRGE